MKFKLEPYLCYLAGLQSRSHAERNAIGIFTKSEALEQKFIDLALKKLKIEPNHLIIEDKDGAHHVFFYHSKLGGQLRKVSESCNILFKLPTEQSRNYAAGIFDAAGHVSGRGLYIKGMTVQESVMLQQLGVQTSGQRIRSITRFLALVKGFSVMADNIHLSLANSNTGAQA